eukprot:CAMPEP_0115302614 /NCGR_PEP_ID=MMETSP0270-20121206/70478_1 /TAXON_ID=71861 /ORGANISM="Scrippsiella trochoidea, Strain CCMP3099" /LENGTH=100 /DNA_ID=CAMNT_0002720555 /DNA_START=18 /DNA_END=317 /DNA_ORIENTATION=-
MASTQNTTIGPRAFSTMVHNLFPMLFAALLLCLLYNTGFKTRTNYCASCEEGAYGWCQIAQDLRSIWSFAFGAYLCSCLEGFYNPLDLLHSEETQEEHKW